MPAPKEILDLCERFEAHRDSYESGHYNETQLRREFLDPFFTALGWDVDNKAGYAEAYKEVIHEDAIKIGGATKAPDYSFRVGGTRKFFVEAKKPSVNIKGATSPAYQLRRYAWSAKLPLSILSDFGEFAVYDCRIRPTATDGPTVGRTHYFGFEDYADKWDEMAAIFSKEAILQGAFDKFASKVRSKRGTVEVDAAFLEDIEEWREALARNIALRNPAVSQRELNFSVGRIIDRIIFLRICEDRGIEPEGSLRTILDGTSIYKRLCEKFYEADQRYNSGLFHFEKEAERAELPDKLTPSLVVDDKILKDIRKRLYLPDSPYEFSVLPADILGQVYEQFLGKVIVLSKGHRAHVEDKPEVKKAGGVFYTPTYIVSYIVKSTLGALLDKGKNGSAMDPVDVANIRVLDPACGSGSFLIAAYQHLLDWHRDYYIIEGSEKHARGKNPKLYRAVSGEWRLTASERKRILLNNIFGVDIDSQAVEVTKLSLLLKVLEGESDESLSRQLRFLHERALPDLGNNIKCGNSLIGSEFYDQQELMLLADEVRYRINAFDWHREFKAGVKAGGFDVIIGNPPYIRIQALKEWAPIEVEYYKRAFKSAAKGNYDIYVVFVERALSLLNESGFLGFILPHKFFTAQYGIPLRALIASGENLQSVVHFGGAQVFKDATTYTCLMFLRKRSETSVAVSHVSDLEAWIHTGEAVRSDIPLASISSEEWVFTAGPLGQVLERLGTFPTRLGDVARLFVGLQTDADDVYILKELRTKGKLTLCASEYTGSDHWLETNHLKPLLKGSLGIRRYELGDGGRRLVFPYARRNGGMALIDEAEYAASFPKTWEYLLACRDRLAGRNKGRTPGGWYGYIYKKNHDRFEQPKLLAPSIAKRACFAADYAGRYYFVGSGGGGGGGYGITLLDGAACSLEFLLGVLNSRLTSAYLRSTSTPFRGGYLALNRQYIEKIPIPPLDSMARQGLVTQIELSVARMMEVKSTESTVRTDHEKTAVERQIQKLDREIDEAVHALFSLTDSEIRAIEASETE